MQFEEECRRQSQVIAAADRQGSNLWTFLDAALADLLMDESEEGDRLPSDNEPRHNEH